MSDFLFQYRLILSHYLRLERASAARLIAIFMFTAIILISFTFAHGRLTPDQVPAVFLAEAYLSGFLALQLFLARISELESQDQVFLLLRTYPLRSEAWFLAKFTYVATMGSLTVLAALGFALVFFADQPVDLFCPEVFLIAFIAVLCLSSIGVLLSLMTMGARDRQILYPLLFFPLTAPILIAAIESSRSLLVDHASLLSLTESWFGLLMVIGIVYGSLGLMLYGLLIHAES